MRSLLEFQRSQKVALHECLWWHNILFRAELRFFLATEKMVAVYDWLGSLDLQPQHFSLHVPAAGNSWLLAWLGPVGCQHVPRRDIWLRRFYTAKKDAV